MAERTPPSSPDVSRQQAAQRVIGSGIAFPVRFSDHGAVRSVELVGGHRKIEQSIHLILSTSPGERVNRPTFGCFAGDTKILTLTGSRIPIASLADARRVVSFGTIELPENSRRPNTIGWCPTLAKGSVSKGVRPVVQVTLSNDETFRCTPDHHFLMADYRIYKPISECEPGTALAWLDTSPPDFKARVFASRFQRGGALGSFDRQPPLFVIAIEEAGQEEVFDLMDSNTNNFTLAAGPIVHNSRLPELVFEPNDEILWPLLRKETADALRIWEKRIQITNIDFINPAEPTLAALLPDTRLRAQLRTLQQDDSVIGISISYYILRLSSAGIYVYPFSRKTAPFSYNIPEIRSF